RLLTRGDRARLFAGALRLAARGSALAGRTVAEALADVGQSRAACERFWHPLAIATLNEAPEIAAAAPFAAVLRRAFFAGARAARFALAAVPLSELYTSDARRAIGAAGGTVATGAAVASLALEGERVGGVLLRDGRRVDADAVVLAVPCAALLRLLPPALRDEPPFRALAAIGTSPIVSVHLWLDRPVGWGSSFLGLLGGRAHWLFDCGPARDGGQRVSGVTTGARFWDDASAEANAAEPLARSDAVRTRRRALRLHVEVTGCQPATLSPFMSVLPCTKLQPSCSPVTVTARPPRGRLSCLHRDRLRLALASLPLVLLL